MKTKHLALIIEIKYYWAAFSTQKSTRQNVYELKHWDGFCIDQLCQEILMLS